MSTARRLTYNEAIAQLAARGVRIQDASVREAVKQLAALGMVAPPPRPRRRNPEPRHELAGPRDWLRALAHEGWSIPAAAEATGLSQDTITNVRRSSGDRTQVSKHTYDAIKQLYEDELSPISFNVMTAGYAERYGWPTRVDLESRASVQTSDEAVG